MLAEMPQARKLRLSEVSCIIDDKFCLPVERHGSLTVDVRAAGASKGPGVQPVISPFVVRRR
jgi:hypothetical protein